jgi:hypothetical protein
MFFSSSRYRNAIRRLIIPPEMAWMIPSILSFLIVLMTASEDVRILFFTAVYSSGTYSFKKPLLKRLMLL